MAKRYVVTLTADERGELERVVSVGRSAAWKMQPAWALLKADQGEHGPGWTDARIAEAYGVSVRSLESWRKRCVEEGPEALLERKPRLVPPVPAKLDGEGEARLTALACSQPPAGRARWSLRLLASKLGSWWSWRWSIRSATRRCGGLFKKRLEAVATVWMFNQPLAGWRDVRVSERKTAVDWAQQVKALVDDPRFLGAERITLAPGGATTSTPTT